MLSIPWIVRTVIICYGAVAWDVLEQRFHAHKLLFTLKVLSTPVRLA